MSLTWLPKWFARPAPPLRRSDVDYYAEHPEYDDGVDHRCTRWGDTYIIKGTHKESCVTPGHHHRHAWDA